MVARLFAPQFLVLYWFAITAMIVHFRGRDRLTLTRQLTDHSTLLAPYNVLMYWFSALPNRPVLPTASIPQLAKLRENWEIIRDEALALSEQGGIKAADKYNDFGFNSFFRTGWKRFYLKWYDEPLPSAKSACPRTVELLELDPRPRGRHVRHAAARRQTGAAPRPLCRIAALSPRPGDAEVAGRMPHLCRR